VASALYQSARIVNFGCGPAARAGDVNVDGGPTVLISRLPLPSKAFKSRSVLIDEYRSSGVIYRTAARLSFPPASLDGFYASHVFEHMDREELATLLTRIASWLKPRACLRVVLPDLKKLAKAYSTGAIDATEFVKWLNLSTSGQGVMARLFGRARHRWMYDEASFAALLRKSGFQEISARGFREGADPRLFSLDLLSHEHESFYIESRTAPPR
jgi:hypothetical protein